MLGPLQAEQQLAAIEAAATPNMKPEAVTRLTRRYLKIAGRPNEEQPASLHGALQEAFKAAGIQVRYVPKEPAAKATGQAGTRRKGRRG